jgi:hypothetical protein
VPLGEQMRELISDTEKYGYSNEQIGMSVMLSMLFTLDKDKYTGPKVDTRQPRPRQYPVRAPRRAMRCRGSGLIAPEQVLRLSGAEAQFSFMNGDYHYAGQHQGRSYWQQHSAAGAPSARFALCGHERARRLCAVGLSVGAQQQSCGCALAAPSATHRARLRASTSVLPLRPLARQSRTLDPTAHGLRAALRGCQGQSATCGGSRRASAKSRTAHGCSRIR